MKDYRSLILCKLLNQEPKGVIQYFGIIIVRGGLYMYVRGFHGVPLPTNVRPQERLTK